jgi:AcrR family transcriptional regulator
MGEAGYAKGRARRAEIIDRATALFGEAGYRGASLREIAARCGLSHPGLLHHFPTKESLLLAVLQQRDAEDVAWLATAGPEPLAPLVRLVELARRNATRRGLVELFTVIAAEATSPEHPAHQYVVRRYDASRAATAASLARAADAGMLRPDLVPDEAARELVALMDGLQLQWLLDGGATDMGGILEAHVRALLAEPAAWPRTPPA